MIEPLVSDRAVEFDGKVIGYTRIVKGSVFAYSTDNIAFGVFASREEAHAWLVERYAKAQEGE